MIIPTNGYLSLLTTTGGGMTDEGDPIPVSTDWGENIPCRIQTNSYDKRGKYQDGKFIQCSYIIYAQNNLGLTDRIKLIFNNSEKEFTVQSIEYLSLVGQTKITV